MFLKVFFDKKPLWLCDEITAVINEYVHHDDAIFIDELNSHTVKAMIHEMQQPHVHAGVFYHKNFDELKKVFFKKFTFIRAAGGLVTNEQGEVLLIYRKGKWDLPKGKQDKGEKPDECAVREVEEETGLRNVKIEGALQPTYHTYREGARYILKESMWFKMKVTGEQKLVPQIEEDIHEIKWVKKIELDSYYGNSYPSVNELLQSWSDK